MTRFTRPLAVAVLLFASVALAQTSDAVRVELRVVRVSAKDCREALAKLCEKKPALMTEKELAPMLEKCASDRQSNILQTPRLTLDAEKPGTVSVCDKTKFTTAVTVKVVDDKPAMVPTIEEVELGSKFTVTATPSKDGKQVELKLTYHEQQVDVPVPLHPVTTLIPPQGEGQPIPFTHFVQMPKFRELKVKETVTVPDGGTVALFAGTCKATKRSECGAPVLSQVPYLNRLFKNQGFAEVEESVVLFASVQRVKTEEPAKLIPVSAATRAADAELVKLLADYRQACELGKTDEAMRLAVQALAKDPTCFGK
ncbi:MAG: type II and III secretion system protein [Fimbriiglobus sp.]|nr:type II and III secretion system protein [Fimbriiglobus sp.]